ncbi:MAG: TetR/AcrR family transcriptional regulator [Candidatus Binatia bacterium]
MIAPSRKQRELALRQEIIFTAAEAVLAARGFHGTSVDEIARRAEVSVGTLYNLFGSKESLYTALLESRMEDLRTGIRQHGAAAATGLEKLHGVVDAIFAYCAEHERGFRVYVTASHGLEWNVLPQFGQRVFDCMQAFLNDVTALCRMAVRERSLPRLEPKFLAMSLLGTIDSFVTQWATEGGDNLGAYRQGAHAILRALSSAAPRGRAVPVRRLPA